MERLLRSRKTPRQQEAPRWDRNVASDHAHRKNARAGNLRSRPHGDACRRNVVGSPSRKAGERTVAPWRTSPPQPGHLPLHPPAPRARVLGKLGASRARPWPRRGPHLPRARRGARVRAWARVDAGSRRSTAMRCGPAQAHAPPRDADVHRQPWRRCVSASAPRRPAHHAMTEARWGEEARERRPPRRSMLSMPASVSRAILKASFCQRSSTWGFSHSVARFSARGAA